MLSFATNGEEMGRNEVSIFVCNESRWGHMGRNRVSPLEMGIEGRGRVSGHPHPASAGLAGERKNKVGRQPGKRIEDQVLTNG